MGRGCMDARSVAQRIAAAVRGHPFAAFDSPRPSDPPARITVSSGVAAAPEHGLDAESLLSAATRARLSVTRRGGDGVSLAPKPNSPAEPLTLHQSRLAGRPEARRSPFRLL